MGEPVLQSGELSRAHQIGLTDKDLIRKTYLSSSLLTVIELSLSVHRVNQCEDRVQQIRLCNLIVHEKRLRNRARICKPRRLNHNAVKVQLTTSFLGGQVPKRCSKVFPNSATDTAVTHLNDLLTCLRDQNIVINIFFTKFVLDDGNFLTMRFAQNAL